MRELMLSKLTAWIVSVLLIGSASPAAAFVVVIGTAIILAAQTAPADNERTTQP